MADRRKAKRFHKPLILYGLSEECSGLAHHAFNVLMGGETPLGLSDRRAGTKEWLEENSKHLADFFRSSEMLPAEMRAALADALDGRGDPPVRLVLVAGKRRGRISGMWRQRQMAQLGLQAYEAAQAKGAGYPDCEAAAAEAAGMSFRDLQPLLADLRSARERARQLDQALKADLPFDEVARIALAPHVRKRGRKPKSTE